MVDGIEIDKDIAEETLLPDDLNSLAVVVMSFRILEREDSIPMLY